MTMRAENTHLEPRAGRVASVLSRQPEEGPYGEQCTEMWASIHSQQYGHGGHHHHYKVRHWDS